MNKYINHTNHTNQLVCNDIIFFLGAGASIPAGIQGVEGITHKIKTVLSFNQDYYTVLNDIIQLIKKKQENGDGRSQINIENILEIVERIENRSKDTISILYDKSLPIMEKIEQLNRSNISFSSVIKNAIKQQAATSTIHVDYLKGLLDFLISWRPLNIFSTNYDIVVERLCEKYGIKYTDGFTRGWNPSSFKDDVDVRLYKLHGSVTWSRNEKGRYSRNEIILNGSDSHTNIITGDLEIPLILYPGKKLDYLEPVFDTLMELRASLNVVKYVFVIGYRFGDAHLRELFQYAAQQNREFVVIMVSPSAYPIYKNQLAYLSDEKFENESSDRRSSLYSRVICLPYKVEKIMPYLKKNILDNLILADSALKKNREEEQIGKEADWIECLIHYSKCEHIQQVDQIVDSLNWLDLENKDWKSTFELSFKTLINSVHSFDKVLIGRWKELFVRTTEAYLPASIRFQCSITPAEIRLEFKKNAYTSSIPYPNSILEGFDNLVSFLEEKELYIGRSEALTDLKFAVKRLRAYFKDWINQRVRYPKYYEMRRNRMSEIQQLEDLVTRFLSNGTREEEVASCILMIEGSEIRELADNLEKCISNYEIAVAS